MRQYGLLRIGYLLLGDRRELCLVRNLSAGGALVRAYSSIPVGRPVALELKEGESVKGTVRWCEGAIIGIMFDHLVDILQLLADSEEWPRPRQPRVEVQCLAWLRHATGECVAQTIDISQGGLKVRCKTDLHSSNALAVSLRGMPELEAYARWQCNDILGLVFKEQLPLEILVRWVRSLQAPIPSLNARQEAA